MERATVSASMRSAGGDRARRPLSGRRVLVTRPRHQAEALSRPLRALGAEVVAIPTIRISDPPDRGPLLRAVSSLSRYGWVVLTSANGVRKLEAAVAEVPGAAEALREARVAAIGPATARAARALGARVSVVPESYRAEALVEALVREGGVDGTRILIPRAAEARSVLPEGLEAAGAAVDEVAAYVTLPATADAERLRELLRTAPPDWVTFTSSSTVRNFVDMAGAGPAGGRVAVIGPITADTARERGVRVDVVAEEYTIPGLVRAVAEAEAAGPLPGRTTS